MSNSLYTVERRRSQWAVYSPQGSKVKTFVDYRDAKAFADRLNLKPKQ